VKGKRVTKTRMIDNQGSRRVISLEGGLSHRRVLSCFRVVVWIDGVSLNSKEVKTGRTTGIVGD